MKELKEAYAGKGWKRKILLSYLMTAAIIISLITLPGISVEVAQKNRRLR